MRKVQVIINVNGEGEFRLPLEVEDFVTDDSLPFRLIAALKDVLLGRQFCYRGVGYDPDDFAKEQVFLSAVCGVMGARKVKSRKR